MTPSIFSTDSFTFKSSDMAETLSINTSRAESVMAALPLPELGLGLCFAMSGTEVEISFLMLVYPPVSLRKILDPFPRFCGIWALCRLGKMLLRTVIPSEARNLALS
jgi:hypothetical protein